MSPRKKINITLIICGILFISLIVFGISPLFKKIRENSCNLLTSQEEIALLDIKSQSFDTLKDSYEVLGTEKELDSFFIDSEIDTNFIEFLIRYLKFNNWDIVWGLSLCMNKLQSQELNNH